MLCFFGPHSGEWKTLHRELFSMSTSRSGDLGLLEGVSLQLMSRAECIRCRYTRKPANMPTYSLPYRTRTSSESIGDCYRAYTCTSMMDVGDHDG